MQHLCNSGSYTAASGHESTDAASNDSSADGAVTQAGSAVSTNHQVTTGDEDDGHQFVHAHLAGPLLLQLPQQLLWARVLHCPNTNHKQKIS